MLSILSRLIVVLAVLAVPILTAGAQTRPGALPDLRIASGSRNIAEAWLADPTTRYRHFVLGAQYEAGSVVARLSNGSSLKFTLPLDSVFEDRLPRLADLDGDGLDEIVLVRSYLDRGAALVVIGVVGGKLAIIAETPPTGRPNTWLNPIGIADFDGDGRPDIAYVQMPHVLGRLRVWTLAAGKLVEIGALSDTSNHVIGSASLGLSAVADFDGDGVADIAVPSLDRRSLRFIKVRGGIREIGRMPLAEPAESDFKVKHVNGRSLVLVGIRGGRQLQIAPPMPLGVSPKAARQ